jgi:hypothetical protein
VKKISMDIYNDTGMWMKFSFVVITGEKWKWNESTCRFLSPGWNRNVCFDLDEPRFKNEDSDWKNSAYLESKNGIQRIGLSLLGMSAEPGISGSVYIDNIRAENNADTAADGRK